MVFPCLFVASTTPSALIILSLYIFTPTPYSGAAAQGDLGDTSDPRRVIVEEFRVTFSPDSPTPVRSDIVHCLSSQEGLDLLAKEGIRFVIKFRVQHEIVAGLRFVNAVTSSMGIFGETEELVIGSYAPSSKVVEFEFPKGDYK
jgi:hypothetical protein